MDLKEILERLEKFTIDEMARINNLVEVNNEDITNEKGVVINKKFAHFHWLYKRKIHFKFANRIPENIQELKKLLAFKSDKTGISDKELKKVLKDIHSEFTDFDGETKTTYQAAYEKWEELHPNRDLASEVVVI